MIIGEPYPVPFSDNIKPYQALSDASSNLLIGEWVFITLICIVEDFNWCIFPGLKSSVTGHFRPISVYDRGKCNLVGQVYCQLGSQ